MESLGIDPCQPFDQVLVIVLGNELQDVGTASVHRFAAQICKVVILAIQSTGLIALGHVFFVVQNFARDLLTLAAAAGLLDGVVLLVGRGKIYFGEHLRLCMLLIVAKKFVLTG